MKSVMDVLEERGYIADCTDYETLAEKLANESITV